MANDYEKNTLKLEKGVIAMARNDYSAYASYYGSSITKEGYNSAGSQFFIMTTDDNISLTGSYSGFGKVIDGFDIIEDIEENERVADEDSGKLNKNLTIKKAIIDLKGKEYSDVEKIN